jgi:uncharacterized protein (DUF58 family)
MIDLNFVHQLNRFNLVIRKRVTSNFIGPRQSVFGGVGQQFKDHRIYAPGDDIKHIDWKVYARTDDYFVKNYEEEKNLIVHIIVDLSGSMGYGRRISKADYASMIGVGFAYLATKDNEKFRFSTFSDDISVFQSRRGLHHLGAMVDHLNNVHAKGHSKLYDCMRKYKKYILSRSMIILISDFLVPIDEIRSALQLFGKQDMKIIQVLDPVERSFNLSGDLKLIDSENKEILNVDVSPRLRNHYQNELDKHAGQINTMCESLGVDFYQVSTDHPIFQTFYDLFEKK